jgi:hypothetical protein
MHPEPPVRHISQRSCRARGWTNGLLALLVGPPVKTAANPYFYKNGGRMKLYNFDEIIEAESDPRWQQWQVIRAKRQAKRKEQKETPRLSSTVASACDVFLQKRNL